MNFQHSINDFHQQPIEVLIAMKQEHMNKARTIFQKGAEQMIAAGVDPADVSAALVGVGASISVNVDGVEATGAWLTEIAESLKSNDSTVSIN